MNPDKILQVWKPLKVGQRVRVTAKCYRGQRGTIAEVLCIEPMNGVANYGVRLENSPNQITDLRRHELSTKL